MFSKRPVKLKSGVHIYCGGKKYRRYRGSFLYFHLLECVVVVIVIIIIVIVVIIVVGIIIVVIVIVVVMVMEKCLLKPATKLQALLFAPKCQNVGCFFFFLRSSITAYRGEIPLFGEPKQKPLLSTAARCHRAGQRCQDVLGSRVCMSPCNCTQRPHVSSLTRIDLRLSQLPSLMYSNPIFWQAIWRFRNLQYATATF